MSAYNIMASNIPIVGSNHTPSPNASQTGPLLSTTIISTTWIINNPDYPIINEIKDFCDLNTLSILQESTMGTLTHLKVSGQSSNYETAFSIQMTSFIQNNITYYATLSPIQIPSTWGDVNILGLNSNPLSHPYVKRKITPKDTSNVTPNVSPDFTPLQLATIYNFPTGLSGSGQKIGIIELGGGYVLSDITHYFSTLGISTTPSITAVSVDGASNNPSDTSGANLEVILDIEVIAAIVPSASIRVYFGPNSDQGFYDAIHTAITDGCSIISISWGAPEAEWSSSVMNSYNSLFQGASTVTILVASGDNGSSDGISGRNVDFPASSPYAVACGGTHLVSSNDTTITSESSWSGTGGGVSKQFSIPSYQSSLPSGILTTLNGKRGSPDISADADPNTGYILYSASEGGTIVVGGTSAVAPLWSALFARINQSIGHNVGFVQPTLYANTSICHDITSGSNGAYSATTGWDFCTGWGSPNGVQILNAFNSSSSPPVTNFTGTPLSGASPLNVSFTDTSANSPTSWSWNFGDSNTSTSQNPSHIYLTAGTYTVSLIATNTHGSNTNTKTNYITVTSQQIPIASFTGTPTSGSSPLTVQFTDSSTRGPTSWSWNFGDSHTSTSQNPSHTYSSSGTYTVILTVSNNAGSNSMTRTNYITVTSTQIPVASFSGTPTSGVTPLTVQFTDSSTHSPIHWSWNFGDGHTSTLQNPSHTYSTSRTYSVTLTVSNIAGSNTLTKTNYITATSLQRPVASFSGIPTSGTSPLAVQFTDTSTYSPTHWSWNFGDGNTSTSQTPSHTYTNTGTYTVTLTVSNNAGSNSLIKNNYISVANTLMANFIATPLSGNGPTTITFTDESTGSPTGWLWTFGDGGTTTTRNPTHRYQNAGSYTVTLKITRGASSDILTKTHYITITHNSPFASFTGVPVSGSKPLSVHFTDTSTHVPTRWMWNFGDGSLSASQNPIHTFTRAGTYTIKLTVTNAYGSSSTTKMRYIVTH